MGKSVCDDLSSARRLPSEQGRVPWSKACETRSCLRCSDLRDRLLDCHGNLRPFPSHRPPPLDWRNSAHNFARVLRFTQYASAKSTRAIEVMVRIYPAEKHQLFIPTRRCSSLSCCSVTVVGASAIRSMALAVLGKV